MEKTFKSAGTIEVYSKRKSNMSGECLPQSNLDDCEKLSTHGKEQSTLEGVLAYYRNALLPEPDTWTLTLRNKGKDKAEVYLLASCYVDDYGFEIPSGKVEIMLDYGEIVTQYVYKVHIHASLRNTTETDLQKAMSIVVNLGRTDTEEYGKVCKSLDNKHNNCDNRVIVEDE